MPTYVGNKSSDKVVPPVSILKGSSLSKRKLPVVGDAATVEAMAGTPTDCGNKAACPQGTSPMTRDAEKDNELEVESLGMMEIDGKEDA